MALRFSGTDPFLRTSIGAFNGYGIRSGSPNSGASLLKRNATSAWHGIHTIDAGGTTNWHYPMEFNPSNQLAQDTSNSGWTTAATYTSTADWMILAFTWTGGNTTGDFVWRWKIGAGAWQSETDTATAFANAPSTAGSGYRHIIGNNASLGDDANFDWVCTGLIQSSLSQATVESLSMTGIASWDAVFTGTGAWLIDGEATATRTDRAGNGGDETSRSAGLTLVSDPSGWSWGGAAATELPILLMPQYQAT